MNIFCKRVFLCLTRGFLLLCLLPAIGFSQSLDQYPVYFGSYFLQPSLINPAFTNLEYEGEFFAGNQSYTGAFSKIRAFYVSGSIRTGRKRKKNHCLGVVFQNQKEGELIGRTRGYFNYSYRIKIFKDYFLSSGGSVGLASFSYKATDVSAGASDSQPDGNIGIAFFGNGFHAGISINQVLEKNLQPLNSRFRLARHLCLTVEKAFDLSPYVKAIPSLFFVFKPSGASDYNLMSRFLFQDKLSAGLSYRHRKSLSFMGGFDNISLNKNFFTLYFSYNLPLGLTSGSGIHSFEISLGYRLKRLDFKQ